MTILSSAYISLTGLLTFSKALDVISDNVANLSTPGFKAGDLFFNSLQAPEEFTGSGRESDAGVPGAGTTATGAGRRFAQGELRETGTPTHLAIDGAGFFVLRDAAGLVLTRAGQFELNLRGQLVDPATQRIVQGLDGAGGLVDITIDRFKTNPPTATSKVAFSGNLSVGSTTHTATRTIFDAEGTERILTFTFTNNTAVTPGSWLVNVKDAQNVNLLDGEIRFQGSGAPAAGFSTLQFNLPSANGTTSAVTLDFGTPGTFNGATSFSAGQTSTLQASSSDGFGIGRLTSFTFGEDGFLTLKYSNGQTEQGARVALASVPDPQELQSETGTVFVAREGQRIEFTAPGQGGLGRLAAANLELANVELSREFADIIILQRGFQASSQVLNISSQLIEDVYNNLSGRR